MARLHRNFVIVLVLFLVVLLRIPSFFEPHWYGDEEIYLALGQMVQRGAVLYRDIWDNKTPLLYSIYAISPTLLWAKLSATIFVLGTVLGVYKLSNHLLTTALVGILLSLPILEGNIANAELYFTLPIVWGAYFVYQRRSWVLVGLLAAAAFLLKVPAILDFVGLLLAYTLTKLIDEYWSTTRDYKRFLVEQVRAYVPLIFSFIIPIILVFLYFFFNRALADFLTAAFSQNASYVAIDSGPFSKLSNPLFVKAGVLVVGVFGLALAYFRRLVSKEFLLFSLWFGFSLYGALLSNRPYKHYLLQIVPPAVILLIYLWTHFRRYVIVNTVYVILLLWIAKTFYFAFALNPLTYYPNFLDWASERKDWQDYINYFDGRTADNYRVAQYLIQNTDPFDPVFVWGDVAAIYTISGRPAATKFIQAHHLTTIDPKNYDLILQRLLRYQPKYIVVTRPVQFPFQALETLLLRNYKQVGIVDRMYIYKNNFLSTPPTWNPNY